MGVAIIDKTSLFDAANSLGKLVPVMNGLTALHFDGKTSGVNQIFNGSALSVVGSPVNENDYVTDYTATAYVKTQSPCTTEGTFVVVTRLFLNTGTNNNTILGWYLNTANRGVSLLNSPSALLTLSCQALASDGVTKTTRNAQLSIAGFTSDTTPAAGKWACIVGRWYKDSSNILTLKLNNLTGNTSASGVGVAGETLVTDTLGNPFAIGSGYTTAGGQGSGTKALAMTALYNRALSDAEMQLMYTGYLQGYFARRGITI